MKCGRCGKSKSLRRLRREIRILQGFYQLQPAYRLSQDLGLDVKVVTRVYHRVREAVYHVTELEAAKLMGVEYQGMVLAAGDEEVQGLVTFEDVELQPGTKVK